VKCHCGRPSQCPMRTCDRDRPPGVSGLPHPAEPAASQVRSQPWGAALQPCSSSSYEPGTWNPGTDCSFPAPLRASTPTSARSQSASQSRAGWTAPRVLAGKHRSMSADRVIAHHRPFWVVDDFPTTLLKCRACGQEYFAGSDALGAGGREFESCRPDQSLGCQYSSYAK
jgi:hypothetical protein